MSKHRPINDYDLLNVLHENQSLLKTILSRLQKMTNDPSTPKEDLVVYQEFLKDIKFVFNENTKLKEEE